MNNAKEIYTAVPKMHNCAQAVVCGGGREDLYDEMKKCGGGNAPGGMCGALYGAMMLIGEADREKAAEEFKNILGGISCSELKNILRVPCADCVGCAADIADKFHK